MMEPKLEISSFFITYMPYRTQNEARLGPITFEEAIDRYEKLKQSSAQWATLWGRFCKHGCAESIVIAHWEKQPETLAEAAEALLKACDLRYPISNEYLVRLQEALEREKNDNN